MCKNFDATFWVSTERHPDAIDQMIGMPKKVHQLNLEAYIYLKYIFQLWSRMAGSEIKEQSP